MTGSRPLRLDRLDGLRGLAALGVALHHVFLHYAPWPLGAGQGVATWLRDWGWSLVDLFFVLSGYVFAHVYLTGDGLTARRALADFAVARFARLYPLHLVMLLLVAAFTFGTAHNGTLEFVANLLMLQALLQPFAQSFDQPSWSLSVEAFCYVVFACAAHAGPGVLRRTTVAAVVASASYLALLGSAEIADPIPRGFLGFFVGQILWHRRVMLARAPTLALLALLVGGLVLSGLPISPALPLSLCAWPAALLLALRIPLLASPAMVWLGDRSYAIYLVNLPLILAVGHVCGTAGGLGIQIALVVALLGLSELSCRLIERPARAFLRARWRRSTADWQPA